ncbi:MAG: hypothetical protein WA160_11120 [Pseudobdellovibrio sp.]
MKKLITIALFSLVFPFATQANQCVNLFSESQNTTQSDSSRIEISKASDPMTSSTLVISEGLFSSNMDLAALELSRMLLQNSSFTIEEKSSLLKNKLVLGIPIKDGYSLQVTYESDSRAEKRFILSDKIILITPTGREIKITDSILSMNELKIENSTFDIKNFLSKGLKVHLNIPLSIDKALLERFSKLSFYFQFFSKDELREVLKSDSIFKIQMLFRLRRAKVVFKNVLIKEPFKIAISAAVTFAVINYNPLVLPSQHKQIMTPPVAVQEVVLAKSTINGLTITNEMPIIKNQLAALKEEARAKLSIKDNFSTTHSSWIFKQVNPKTGLTQTYLGIAEEKNNSANTGLQYYIYEIDTQKYQQLVSYALSNEKR